MIQSKLVSHVLMIAIIQSQLVNQVLMIVILQSKLEDRHDTK